MRSDILCKYCCPNDEIMKSYHWEELDNDLGCRSSAYIVPSGDKYTRHTLVVSSKELKFIVADIVLNYCPVCGEKLPE